MSAARHVAVLGGGITGLVAANALLTGAAAASLPLQVSLIEPERRLGGKIRTVALADTMIDVGAESLMTAHSGAALELVTRLGLERELIPSGSGPTLVLARGVPRPLPAGVLSGAPGAVGPLLRSRVLSPVGAARAAFDLVAPPTRIDRDCTVADLVTRRLGREVLERLVDPLLGTIHAADCELLSAAATAPQMLAALRSSTSLIRGLRAARAAAFAAGADSQRAPFITLHGGLGRLVDCLAERLATRASVRLGARAVTLGRSPAGGYLLRLADGQSVAVDGALIAAPAPAAATILSELCPPAASLLGRVRYASAVVVTLRCRTRPGAPQPPFTGLLVPRCERRLLGALTVLSAKWPHLVCNGELWLRASIARHATERAFELSDDELVRALSAELRQLIGPLICGGPLEVVDRHVMRWRACLPVYQPGHLERLDALEREIRRLPAVELAGAAYRGVGVPRCIEQALGAARRLLAAFGGPPADSPAAGPAPERNRHDNEQDGGLRCRTRSII